MPQRIFTANSSAHWSNTGLGRQTTVSDTVTVTDNAVAWVPVIFTLVGGAVSAGTGHAGGDGSPGTVTIVAPASKPREGTPALAGSPGTPVPAGGK